MTTHKSLVGVLAAVALLGSPMLVGADRADAVGMPAQALHQSTRSGDGSGDAGLAVGVPAPNDREGEPDEAEDGGREPGSAVDDDLALTGGSEPQIAQAGAGEPLAASPSGAGEDTADVPDMTVAPADEPESDDAPAQFTLNLARVVDARPTASPGTEPAAAGTPPPAPARLIPRFIVPASVMAPASVLAAPARRRVTPRPAPHGSIAAWVSGSLTAHEIDVTGGGGSTSAGSPETAIARASQPTLLEVLTSWVPADVLRSHVTTTPAHARFSAGSDQDEPPAPYGADAMSSPFDGWSLAFLGSDFLGRDGH